NRGKSCPALPIVEHSTARDQASDQKRSASCRIASDRGNSTEPWHDCTSIKEKRFWLRTDLRFRAAVLPQLRMKLLRSPKNLAVRLLSKFKRGLPVGRGWEESRSPKVRLTLAATQRECCP